MNRDVYFKFFPDSWRADEQLGECPLAARGLWVEMMCLAHKHGGVVLINGRVPSLEALAKAARTTPREVRQQLHSLLHMGVCSQRVEDGAFYSRRMVRDHERRARNRENGSKGGNPLLSDNPVAEKSVNRVRPTILAVASSSSDSVSSERKELDPHGASFAVFWKRYPNHKAKADALRAWRKLAPSPDLIAEIHAALDWQTRQHGWVKDRGQFVPMGATYLNGRRWEDERVVLREEQPIPDWTEECRAMHSPICESRYQHGLLVGKERAS